MEFHQQFKKIERKRSRGVVSVRKISGVSVEMIAGTANPISMEHVDITVAAGATFASASANSWIIG